MPGTVGEVKLRSVLVIGVLLSLLAALAPSANAVQLEPVQLSGLVWSDIDFDGLSDLTESGIAGVSVKLWTATAGGAVDSLVAAAVTNTQGRWNLDVAPNTYIVEWQAPATFAPTIYGGPNAGQSAVQANGRSEPFTLTAGQTQFALDAGYVAATVGDRAEVGGLVWSDDNADGIRQIGEAPISGVVVNVWVADVTGAPGQFVAAQTTDLQGRWTQEVQPDTYVLQWVTPADSAPTVQGIDSAVGADGQSEPFVVGPGEMSTRDAGYRAGLSANLGGFVWSDGNGDGLQQPGEAGLANEIVTVWSAGADSLPESIIATIATESDGRWKQRVVPGAYVLQWRTPVSTAPTLVGNEAENDSDVLNDGFSKVFEVERDELILRDAGYRPFIAIGGAAWRDENQDGDQQRDEVPLPGLSVEVSAVRGSTAFDRTIVTAADGSWSTTVPAGEWDLAWPSLDGFELPASTASRFVVSAGRPQLDLDAGYVVDEPAGPQVQIVIKNDSTTDPAASPGGALEAPSYSFAGVAGTTSVAAGQQQSFFVPANSSVLLNQQVAGIADPRTPQCVGAVSASSSSEFVLANKTSATTVNMVVGDGPITCTFVNDVRRYGDVNCDGQLSILDASIIAQFSVGTRAGHTACPTVPGASQIHVGAADSNGDQVVNVLDAFRVAQCSVGLTNSMCP